MVYLKKQIINDHSSTYICTGDEMEEKEENADSYYLNQDADETAQFLFQNPEYKVLFDASRKVKPEDINFVAEMIERLSNK